MWFVCSADVASSRASAKSSLASSDGWIETCFATLIGGELSSSEETPGVMQSSSSPKHLLTLVLYKDSYYISVCFPNIYSSICKQTNSNQTNNSLSIPLVLKKVLSFKFYLNLNLQYHSTSFQSQRKVLNIHRLKFGIMGLREGSSQTIYPLFWFYYL